MGTITETMWVHDKGELDATVQNLITQGGLVQYQADDAVTLMVKKKINWAVLIVGFILCIVPGLAYLIWYLTDKDQQVTVRIGQAAALAFNAGAGEHSHWYDKEAKDGASPGTVPREVPETAGEVTSTNTASTAGAAPAAQPAPPPAVPPASPPPPVMPGAPAAEPVQPAAAPPPPPPPGSIPPGTQPGV